MAAPQIWQTLKLRHVAWLIIDDVGWYPRSPFIHLDTLLCLTGHPTVLLNWASNCAELECVLTATARGVRPGG